MIVQLDYFDPKTGNTVYIWSGDQEEEPIIGDEFRLYYSEGGIYYSAQFRVIRSERIIYDTYETANAVGTLAEMALRVEPIGTSGVTYIRERIEAQEFILKEQAPSDLSPEVHQSNQAV